MDQTVRNKLRNVVTQCRKLLEDATAQALQGRFGIYAARKKGEVHIEDESRMVHLSDEDRACRQDLLDHLAHIQAIGYKPREALEQLIREIAFTHLNRLCAYKMMEARGLIRESVSRGLKSQGFFFYLADHPEDEKLHNAGQQEVAYRNFLNWLGGTLSEEIGVLFNPNDPANRIYPPQRVLDEVLDLINNGALSGIWSQDETIGWVYQYFTPKELRDKARKESQAPRNSYELAFRNQFYTPRYVVEFLTDNTLGRIWYEMRKGKTALKDRCRYLVRRPTEIFLAEGEEPPAEAKETRDDLSQEELLKQPVYIPHRPKKDPREVRILDPACGSGHFLLYCFDLLQVIYEEAYDDPGLGAALRKDYPSLDDLRLAVPGLILKHNLHGIDIDPRATQIAALALWLRCQRAFQELGLKNGERPKITRSNIVCAEPMPGEADLLKEFTDTLQPKVLGQLIEVVFEKMKLAGEAGSLLKIEEGIRDAVAKAKAEYQEEMRRRRDEAGYLPGMAPPREPTLFDFADMTDEAFLDRAEEEIVEALRRYATKAENGRGFRRRLFAEDAAQGFAFIDICHKRFDVVLMNPPFGLGSKASEKYLNSKYVGSGSSEVCASFYSRVLEWLNGRGFFGAISSRTFFYLYSLKDWRCEQAFPLSTLHYWIDLGQGILDDAVNETAAYIVSKGRLKNHVSLFGMYHREQDKQAAIAAFVSNGPRNYARRLSDFEKLPDKPLCYWVSNSFVKNLGHFKIFGVDIADVQMGLAPRDEFRFSRLWWEVDPNEIGVEREWLPYAKGGELSPYYSDVELLLRARDDLAEIKASLNQKYPYLNGNLSWVLHPENHYFEPGLTFGQRTTFLRVSVLPKGGYFSVAGKGIFGRSVSNRALLQLINTPAAQYLISLRREFLEINPQYQEGDVARMPWPEVPLEDIRMFEDTGRESTACARSIAACDEVDHSFSRFVDSEELWERLEHCKEVVKKNEEKADASFSSLLGLSIQDREFINSEILQRWDLRSTANWYETQKVDRLQYAIGCIFGRWDIRIALDPSLAPKLPDPFDPLPVCPPGMLVGPDGLTAKPGRIVSEEWLRVRPDANTLPPDGAVSKPTIPDSEYPLRISWDGILVDDPGHEDDIVRRVREVLEVVWKNRAEAIEKEACEILGVRELRDYFRKPGNGGFWMDHVKRYSKSRRKAPIYWYLRSAKGSYGLWLYYHRLDKDILFKALLNYVEPKIRLEEDRLNTLRSRKEAAGSSGREAKQIEKEMDRQEQLISELHDFKDKLRRVADLHITPDLNDGVILNIAPLWELVPWKEPKKYWEALQEGKYDWSHIKDRSIAIAHGREDLCEVEPPRASRKKRVN